MTTFILLLADTIVGMKYILAHRFQNTAHCCPGSKEWISNPKNRGNHKIVMFHVKYLTKIANFESLAAVGVQPTLGFLAI